MYMSEILWEFSDVPLKNDYSTLLAVEKTTTLP